MDEQEAISKSKNGDVDGFNWLVATYERLVYNVALRMMGNNQDAEDAAQDSFLSAYKSITRFNGVSFKPWICRITANTCIDKIKHNKRRPTTPIENAPREFLSTKPSDSPEEHASRKELKDYIDRTLSLLPPNLRLVVVLADVQGMTYEETSEIMGCSLGTVKSRLFRGRRKMRELLLEHRELLPSNFRYNK